MKSTDFSIERNIRHLIWWEEEYKLFKECYFNELERKSRKCKLKD